MSKVEHIRPRYIAVRITSDRAVGRKAFAQAVQAAARKAGWPEGTIPTVSRFTWPHAAVRIEHERAGPARKLLGVLAAVLDGEPKRAVAVAVTTLATSGSLAGLARQTGVLVAREPRPGEARGRLSAKADLVGSGPRGPGT